MSKKLEIAIIQTNLIWEDKIANLNNLETYFKQINSEVVILPEMFTTGFSMNTGLAETMSGDTILWMKKMSIEYNCYIIGSVIICENNNFYNRLICIKNNFIEWYDKKHLFGFAGEDKSYTPGNQRKIVEINSFRINLQICYDLRFPVFARNQNDYDVLIYVANWPKKRALAWNTLLQARAIENQSYVIGVNRVGVDGLGNEYSGDSKVISPLGEIISECMPNNFDVKKITLEKDVIETIRKSFPFLNDADKFSLTY